MMQGSQDGKSRVVWVHYVVGKGLAGTDGLRVRIPGEVIHPCHSCGHGSMALDVLPGTGEAGQRMADHDDVGFEFPQSFVPQPHPVDSPGAEILNYNVAHGGQSSRQLLAFGMSQVDGYGHLVAIEIVEPLTGVQAAVTAWSDGRHLTRSVVAGGRFYPYHLSSTPTQHPSADGGYCPPAQV